MTDAVHVLWTGGWDSTYRILYLLCVTDRVVQPHYIVDSARKSTLNELKVIEGLRAKLIKQFGEARLLVPQVYLLSSLTVAADMLEMWRRLRRQVEIGEQYYWLSAYADYKNIDALELCIHRDDKAHALLVGHTSKVDVRGLQGHVVKDDAVGDFRLFRRFSFPLFDMTKRDMELSAAELGVDEMLRHTWFCFNPIRGRFPCGRCNPCLFAFQEGMARRIGWRGLLLGIPLALLKRGVSNAFRTTR